MRAGLTATLLAVAITCAPGVLEAQTPDDDAELAAIDEESAQATGFYIAASVLVGSGVVATVVGFLADVSIGEWLIPTGIIVGTVGLFMFIPAIILDLDSGRRRDELARAGSLQLRLAGRLGGGTLSLGGRF